MSSFLTVLFRYYPCIKKVTPLRSIIHGFYSGFQSCALSSQTNFRTCHHPFKNSVLSSQSYPLRRLPLPGHLLIYFLYICLLGTFHTNATIYHVFLKTFIALVLTFRSKIHFEFNCFYSVRWGIKFILLPCTYPAVSNYLKRLLILSLLSSHLCQKSSHHKCKDISRISTLFYVSPSHFKSSPAFHEF